MTAAGKELSRAELATRFREAGLKATPQRVAIYRVLARSKEHPSPENVYRAVRAAMPSISLATVYKALDALRGAGLVEQVSRVGETMRYDANLDPHHHLVCTRCFAIRDVQLPELDAVPRPSAFPGFSVRSLHVQVLGLCEACAEAASRERAEKRVTEQ